MALGAAWAEREATAPGERPQLQAEGSQPQIHYAPRENLENVDVSEIGRAQLCIDMAAYVLSDQEVIEALIGAAERGVVIRLYFDKSNSPSTGPREAASSKPCSHTPMLLRGSRARACSCI